jgi:hypothetical protein
MSVCLLLVEIRSAHEAIAITFLLLSSHSGQSMVIDIVYIQHHIVNSVRDVILKENDGMNCEVQR